MRQIADLVDRQVRFWEARGRAAAEERARRGVPYRPVVALSRQAATGGEAVARIVADQLGFPVFDKEILSYIAQRANVVESMVATIDESGRNWIEDSIQTLFDDRHISRGEYMELLTRAVLAISAQDGAVIVGRGAERILPRPSRLSVRLVAPEAWRAARLAEERGVSRGDALETVRATDEARRRFVRTEFRGDIDDVFAYDLVVDASRFTAEGIAAIVVEAYRAL